MLQSAMGIAALRLSNVELPRCREPEQALNAFDRVAQMADSLRTMGAWSTPGRPRSWPAYFKGQHIFQHTSVPKLFWPEFFQLAAELGPSATAQMAWATGRPFTFTECMRASRPRGDGGWIFELLAKHGIRDGFYMPIGKWMVVTWSPKLVRLSTSERATLAFAAAQLVARLAELTKPKAGQHLPHLTARELQVLERMSLGDRLADVAKHLDLTLATVRTFEQRAQRKLGARTPAQAVAEAMRHMLMR
jgi:DNA-binding CsgD family transcriptional regulator